eukprot:scaffold3235_cov83-Cylindrotheca_fusiformis.AAC.3
MSLITMASTACRRTALFPTFLSSSSPFRATSRVMAPTATSKSLFFSSLVNNNNNHITTATTTADNRSNTNNSNYQDSRHKCDGTEIRRQYHPTHLVPQEQERGQEDFKTTVPTLDVAQSMPVGMAEMSNEMLVTISAMGHHEAHCEVLKRHVMAVDEISYEDAIWFNDLYVTTDIPEPRDLETRLEVGAWTWNWMEPPLGTLSFSLLCLQYARAQLENLGLHPYTTKIINRRAEGLAKAYPQYDAIVIKQFSKSDPLAKSVMK